MVRPFCVSMFPCRNMLEDYLRTQLPRFGGCNMSTNPKGTSRIIDGNQGLPLLNSKRFVFGETKSYGFNLRSLVRPEV